MPKFEIHIFMKISQNFIAQKIKRKRRKSHPTVYLFITYFAQNPKSFSCSSKILNLTEFGIYKMALVTPDPEVCSSNPVISKILQSTY